MRLDIKRIEAAVRNIDPIFLNSPQYVCEGLSRALGCRIVLKVETLNPIRCFKGRGTETVLAGLRSRGGPNAVVCASAGNLGQALAYSGRLRNCSVTVTASSKANPSKIERMKLLGANVILKEGMRLLYRCSGLIVEPAAALGIASILENRDRFRGRTVATILCGGGISTADFERWVVQCDRQYLCTENN